jgi:uncharacterized integral membrane protein
MADDNRRWETGDAYGEKAGFKPSGKQIGAGIVAVLLVVFVLQNTETTSVTMLIFDINSPLWMVLAVTILLSIGVGYALGSRRGSRKKR